MEREFEVMERGYNSWSAIFRRLVTLGEYCSIMIRRMNGRALPGGRVIPRFLDKQQSEEKTRKLEPHRSAKTKGKELCYHYNEPWELDHRCRGKGKVHYVEVHYDSDDEEDACDEDDRWPTGDPPSVELSSEVSAHVGKVEELHIERTTPQFDHLVEDEEYMHEEAALNTSFEQSHEPSDTHASHGQSDDQGACEGSDVLAPRHAGIWMLGDLPLGVDMTSRKSCMGDDEPSMELSVTHSSSS
jgi:hypothetical protein